MAEGLLSGPRLLRHTVAAAGRGLRPWLEGGGRCGASAAPQVLGRTDTSGLTTSESSRRESLGRRSMSASSVLALPLLGWLVVACDARQQGAEPPGAATADKGPVIGLVLTDFTFEQPPMDPELACPDGFNMNEFELAHSELAPPELQIIREMPPEQFLRQLRESGAPDPCEDPAIYRDPSFKTMDTEPAVSYGFNLRDNAPAAAGSDDACPRQPFVSPDGEPGIDNQLWRVLGCIKGYQRGEVIDEYALTNIREGARTILIRLSGLDDERNGENVKVGIYSSPDPIPTDSAGNLLSGASLSVTENPRFHNEVQGTLVDGVLTAGPFDLRLDFQGQFLKSEYDFRNAHLRLELQPDGGATGLLGGYWDIEAFYDAYGRQATRAGVFFVGFTCPGMYAALHRLADGHPDLDTGACTSISTTFRLKAMPAFVIMPQQAGVAATAESP